ncbi:MAG: hemolysin family protein [Pseudomonadota bacterium]|nr:hemolysin family protein [Pseudomonadota bacterium]
MSTVRDEPKKVGPEFEMRKGQPSNLVDTFRALLGLKSGSNSFRESIEELIEEHHEDSVPGAAEERTMFRNLLDFGRLDVADVMVPRADIVAVPKDILLDELIKLICERGHSRVPVHAGSLDEVSGMVHIRDVITYWKEKVGFELGSILRPLLYVPSSMRIQDLLLEMRVTKIHMALVVDEFGGTDGLVTIEDLVEEIVGEIEDEHDRVSEPKLVGRKDGLLDADARVGVVELEARINIDLLPDKRDDEIVTLGGLVCELVGRVPSKGELITHPSGLTFEVVEADPRKVRRLRVYPVVSDMDQVGLEQEG